MSLSTIVRSYIKTCRSKAQAELDWFRQQPTLQAAVEYAALAINCRQKRFDHQRRIKRVALEQAKRVLVGNLDAISQSKDFDELFILVRALVEPIDGIGELYVYDTSLRIGAKKSLSPSVVYLHAGTRTGAQFLGYDGKLATIEMSDLPAEFQTLTADEVEDLLCIYKDALKRIAKQMKKRGILTIASKRTVDK